MLGSAEVQVFDITPYKPSPINYYVVITAREGTPGHAFVVFGEENSTAISSNTEAYGVPMSSTVQAYGYYMQSVRPGSSSGPAAVFGWVPGSVLSESISRATDQTLIVKVTRQQSIAARKLILSFPTEHNYQLVQHDCVSFVKKIAETLGMSVPQRDYTTPGAYSPVAYVLELMHTATSPHELELPEGHYVGQSVSGRPVGNGTLTYRTGDTYSGGFRFGHPLGKGVFTTKAGTKVSGNFQFTMPPDALSGEGSISLPNGSMTSGRFMSTQGPTGRYVGQFNQAGQADGSGIFYAATGYHYEGTFHNGAENGWGTARWPDGTRYSGNFVNHNMNGVGTYEFSDGWRFVGNLADGRFRDGNLYDEKGRVYGVASGKVISSPSPTPGSDRLGPDRPQGSSPSRPGPQSSPREPPTHEKPQHQPPAERPHPLP